MAGYNADRKQKQIYLLGGILLGAAVLILGICVGIALSKRSDKNRPEDSSRTESQQSQSQGLATEDESSTQAQNTQDSSGEDKKGAEQIVLKKNVEEFVILGIDSRSNTYGPGSYSDSIMIVHVDHDNKTVKLASLYRDCQAYESSYGYVRVNNAYYKGGAEASLSCFNETFDLNLKKYITLNFAAMESLVNQVGGVEVELTQKEVDYLKWAGITTAGKYHLDGAKALAYSRIRKIDSDFERTDRQRTVLFALFNKVKTLDNEAKINLADALVRKLDTNYDTDSVVNMLYCLGDYTMGEMEGFPKVSYLGQVEGSWTVVPVTLLDMNADLHKFLYGNEDYNPSDKASELNEYMKTLAQEANVDLR